MSKTKEPEAQVVRINKLSDEVEEVFFYREEPYLNEAKYVKPGTYKLSVGKAEEKKKEEG